MNSICGADCNKCNMNHVCKGCEKTKGHPFSGECHLANLCGNCVKEENDEIIRKYREELIAEINELDIKDMPKVSMLYPLNGSFVNMEYNLLNGTSIKLLNDNDIYMGNQLTKINDEKRCFGIAADNKYILICEYGENGTNPEIIIYKKR